MSVHGGVELYLYMDLFIRKFYTCQVDLGLSWAHGKIAAICFLKNKALTQMREMKSFVNM